MEKDLTVRRASWPWKKKSNDKIAASPEFGLGGTTPTPPKLFDEQEVARILDDQSRVADEALRQAEAKAKARDKNLEMALSDLAAKDELVKKHIKVAEEAVIGWDKAEVQSADWKAQLDAAMKRNLGLEDRVKYLEGALRECTQQLQFVHKEQEKPRTHEETVVTTKTKTTMQPKYDELCAEMNAQLAKASQLVAYTRNELSVSQAHANSLTLALKERTAEFAAIAEAKGYLEIEISSLKVKLDGVEKDNATLQQENQILKRDLEMWKAECEYQRQSLESVSQQHVESVKTITRLDAECSRLRIAVNRKLPPGGAVVSRSKQDMRNRRNGLGGRGGHGGRMDNREQDNSSVEENPSEADILAKRIISMEEEVFTLKGALMKRNEELQASRIMCSKTASHLSTVERQLELAMRAGTPSSGNGRELNIWAVGPFDKSKISKSHKRQDSYNFELMDDFVEMEQLAVLQSEPTTISEAGMETMSVASLLHQISDSEKVLQVTDKDQDLQAGGVTASVANLQHQVDDLQKALADKSLDLQAANESCQQLNSRLVNSAEQIAALQAQNQANEASMTQLQEKLDGLLAAAQEGSGGGAQSLCSMHKDAPKARNSVLDPGFKASTVQSGLMGALSKLLQSIKVLAQAIGSEHSSSAKLEQRGKNASSLNIASGGQNAPSIHWKDFRLESAFLNLVRVTNDLLGGKTEIVNFVVELGIVLDGVMLVGDFGSLKQQLEDSVNEKIASQEKLEIAKREIAKYEEELRAFQAERAALESQVRSKLDHVADIESQIDQLISEKQALEVSLSQANEQVKDLKEQLHETKTLLENLPRQEDLERKEDDMLEDELLELSSSKPGLASSRQATDADMTQLNEKVTALEVELHRERNRNQDVITKLEDLQEQIHQGANHSDHSGSSHGREIECSQQSMSDDNETKAARKEREIAAAALAECQRTILALGEQLKVLGFQDLPDAALSSTASPNSAQTTTQTTELQQWQQQTQAVNGNLPGKGIPWNKNQRPPWTQSPPMSVHSPQDHQQNGFSCSPYPSFRQAANGVQLQPENCNEQPVSIPAPPAQSDLDIQGALSSSGSPSMALRSMRTVRSNSKLKSTNGTEFSANGSICSEETLSESKRFSLSTSLSLHGRRRGF
ncbi:unnamed protein product [Sphagnum jensenii]|uniref:Uncharacterized protein n=1 Tax=Sphagnum jensenii TaxID=128206 RepID=A0ABP0VVM1_9BRYO